MCRLRGNQKVSTLEPDVDNANVGMNTDSCEISGICFTWAYLINILQEEFLWLKTGCRY